MIRQIVKRNYFKHSSCPRNANGSVECVLSCGHSKWYKYSQAPKLQAQCTECDRAAQQRKKR